MEPGMSIQAFEASRNFIRAPAAEAARGPFATFKWQAFLAFFMQRIGLNQTIGGVLYPLPVSLIIMPAVLGWLIAKGWAKPSPTRITLYCMMVAGGCISMLIAKFPASALSMYMYFALYIFFLFPVVLEDDAYKRFFRMVAKVGVAICMIGVVQYLLQYALHTPLLFSWRTIIPPEFLIEFNTENFTAWGSGVYKANGFFLMEASWLSQLGARTALIAVIMLKDPRYLIPCALAMLLSYSGTGILLFAIFGAIPLIMLMSKSKYLPWAIAGLIAVALIATFSGKLLNLELFLTRLNEFGRPNTSAYARFEVGGQAFERFLNEPLITILFGAGPATVDNYVQGFLSDGFAPGWLKLVAEYGFFGFVIFNAFLITCVWQTTRSAVIAGAIVFQYMVLDNSLVVPQGAILTLFIACLVVRRSKFRPLGATVQPGQFAAA